MSSQFLLYINVTSFPVSVYIPPSDDKTDPFSNVISESLKLYDPELPNKINIFNSSASVPDTLTDPLSDDNILFI